MSELIKFDTEEAIKDKPALSVHRPKLFALLPENHPMLKEVLLDFDFKNPSVDPSEFASTLVETCKHHRGYGLSANQCGFPYRVFVMGTDNEYVAFFNPEIVDSEGESHMVEGCLSFPLLGLAITRASTVQVKYQDFNGEIKLAKFSGISARCFQHELDHMNGIVYTDRVKPLALQQGMEKRNKILKQIGLRK